MKRNEKWDVFIEFLQKLIDYLVTTENDHSVVTETV